MIPASTWRKMKTDEILESLEIASRILEHRNLTGEQAETLLTIIGELLQIACDALTETKP